MAAYLCGEGWLELYGIVASVNVGFLKTAMFTPVGVLWMVMSSSGVRCFVLFLQ